MAQATIGRTINLCRTELHAKFGSLDHFLALPREVKQAYVDELNKRGDEALTDRKPEEYAGFALFGRWLGVLVIGDIALAKSFSRLLEDLSALGVVLLGPLNSDPLPAGWEFMAEDQRMAAVRDSRERSHNRQS